MSSPAAEDFLLFDMNGSTYVIPQADLQSITSTAKKGRIIPFFAPGATSSTTDSAEKGASTGRGETTIGTDGAGNLSAVYVGTVPATVNNALYLSKYDPISKTWGAGTMLAMNYMQVHEDGIKNNWTPEEREQAFLGAGKDGYIGGGLNQFKFTNLQIALGQTKTTSDVTGSALSLAADSSGMVTSPETKSEDISLFAENPADVEMKATGDGTKDTLLVLTQGSMTYLTKKEVDVPDVSTPGLATTKKQTIITPINEKTAHTMYQAGIAANPDNPAYKNRVPGVGVYAVSYGIGGQAIGESNVVFVDYDFSTGSKLKVSLGFKNTGDVGIRASGTEPALVKLMLKDTGGVTELATWEIKSTVLAGQRVELSGVCKELTKTLQKGDIFYIEVCEDEDYTGLSGFKANTLLNKKGEAVGNLMVDKKSDLSFNSSESSIKAIGIDEKGDTILQVNLFAQNRGNAPASGVFAQFSYESEGTEDLDKDGKKDMVYKPINLTGHNLETADQEELKPFGGITEDGATNLANGIYYLTSPNPGGSSVHGGNGIWANYGRKVTGTFTVPSSFYQGSLTESFNLRVELFSAEDDTTGWDNGLVIAEHNEYNTNNNFLSMQIEHGTSYQSASRITIPMGATMRLPLQLSTTKKVEPNIMVHEVPANKDDMHIGVSYYEHGVFANGRESGTLILAPISMGSGVIHLEDLNTNSIYAVAYTITEAGEGLNIYNDTDMFTFKNINGENYNPDTQNNDWSFPTGVPTWGSSSEPNKTAEPYLRDLSKGKVGTSFTYRTQAESVKFYMDGGADISSTFPGFATRSLYANGGTEYAEVTFGENPTNLAHDVTITITETAKANVDYAEFDRMVESFGTEAPPIPSGGKNAPHIFWSRSFPERGSLTSGAVDLTGYILDDETLATLTVNGKVPEIIQKNSNGFWQFTTSISSNGLLNITASDTAGNRTTRSTKIDWYIDAGPSGSSNAPNLTAALVDKDNNLLTGYLEKGETAFIKATSTTTPPPTYTASYYTKDSAGGLVKTDVIAETGGRFKAENNGFYVVTAKDSVKPQEWSATVLYMDKSDTEAPVVTLELSNTSPQSEGGKLLSWSARKQNQTSTSTIQTATINGYSVYNGTGETWAGGTFPITHAGNYELTATDTAGNEKKTSLEVKDLPIYDPSNDGFETIETRNSWGNDGLILIRTQSNFYSKLKGGKYGGVYHNAWLNEYEGTYSAKFLPKSEATLASVLADDTGWEGTTRVDNLEPGTYTVYIRDDNDKLNDKTAMVRDVVIGNESVQIKLTPEALGGGQGSGQGEAIRRTLNWEAKKDVSGKENISEIKINGITVPTTPAAELKGTLPLEYGGAYELIATSDGRAFSKTETVENVPLATRSKDALVTVERPWNATIDNGKVTVNLTTTTGDNTQKNLTGGKYDPDALSDRDAYIGKYEWRLEPAVSHANPEAEAAWLAAQLAKTEGWVTSALSNLTVGNYILIIRDAQDKGNAATALTIPVAITGELVTFKATSKLAGNSSAADGAIDVEAFGGYLSQNVYQFAARPMKDKNSMGAIEAVTDSLGSEYPEKDGWKQPAWQLGDLAKRVPYQSTLGGLRAGWYQVAVRTMLGVTAADMTALMDLYKTYTDAITAKDEESVIEAAKQAYETKKTKMETASNAGYTATPDLWANAATVAVYVPAVSEPGDPSSGQVKPSDFDYKTEGVVQVTLSAKKPVLSPKAEEQLIADNKDKDLVIGSPMMEVRIPVGSLSAGDDLNAMLMLNVVLPQDASGYVVQYTGKDGKTHIVPFSLVTPKKVYYIAGAVGSYGLTKNAKDFKDIPENFWGANDITFVAEHELFQGITKETFGFADTMTRGMFVTVLGRLAGVNPAEYTKKEFLDVDPDSWYGGFVAWASKNNIVGGVGGNKFEPDTPVTREQMCVMLVRYLEWAKISLPTVAKDKKFEDQAQISAWAESAVELLSSVGIIKGTGQGKFLPGNDATRAEVATIYARLIKMVLGA
ncbi:MAG: S-layer homology domain-containing protein [Clostridia bacterium]